MLTIPTFAVEYLVTIAGLENHTTDLEDAWNLHTDLFGYTFAQFAYYVALLTSLDDDACKFCEGCDQPAWTDETLGDADGNVACDSCREDVMSCQRCGNWWINNSDDGFTYIEGEGSYCESCTNRYTSYCEDCEEYYLDSDDHSHDHSCGCNPKMDLRFKLLANSHGTLGADERLEVKLPSGNIPPEAISTVISTLWYEQFSAAYMEAYDAQEHDKADKLQHFRIVSTVEALDPVWQNKGGNFTKRLSRALYQNNGGVKLDPGLLSKIGARVRDHTADTSSWHVEFTRDLNQSASAFYHEDSCWWGSYSESMCALKHWGGLGMRSYDSGHQQSCFPSGRAWVQPLNENLQPTSEVYGAHAYIIYNGYGNLAGYTPARLLAYLTSRTYKKIELSISYQYINNDNGYLVADQETCDNTTSIDISGLGTHERVAS